MIDFELIVNGQQSDIIPEVYETATLQDNLEHSGGISLSWKSKTDTEIPVGSYITYQGLRYILLDPYAPSKEGGPKNTQACYYKYDPTFKHPQALLDKTPLWFTARDANNQSIELRTTSYTGFPYIIVEQVVNFMAVYANKMADHFFAETVGLELTDPTRSWDATNNPYISTWAVNIPPVIVDQQSLSVDAHTIITVGFDGASIKGAIDSIADAMGCNVYWDWSYTDYEDDDHNITKKRTIRFVAGTTIDGESFNCFHVLGGTTNMGKATVSGGFAAVTQRLTLRTEPDPDDPTKPYYPGSIIDMRPNQQGIRLTKELILDNIYPKMELYIKTAESRTCYLTDEEGNFIVDHYLYYYMNGDTRVYSAVAREEDGKYYDANGHELTPEAVLKTFAKWYITLATTKTRWDEEHQTWEEYVEYARDHWPEYEFNQGLLIYDKPLSMLFQLDYRDPSSMSKLVGRQFELTYFPETTTEWDKTDAVADANGHYTGDKRSYNDAFEAPAGSYRVAFVAEGEIILPTTADGGLCPIVGDKVTLVNMNLDAEIPRAKDELLSAAIEIIGLMQTPKGEYSETVIFGDPDPITGQVPAPRIARCIVGSPSPFGNEHGPIVSVINQNLDTDIAELTVSSYTRKTRTGGTADKVETVSVSANSSTNGSDNYSNGSIGNGNYGGGSDSINTYNNATPKADSLFLASLNNVVDAVACNADGTVKLDTDVITMITCNYGTSDITSVCTILYKNDWPQTGTVGELKTITAFLEDTPTYQQGVTHSVPLIVKNRTYDLSETMRYIRIHFPAGFNMAHFEAKLLFPFVIGHPYFTDRDVSLTVEALIPGEEGQPGADAVAYEIRSNITSIKAGLQFTNTTKAYKKVGDNAPASYAVHWTVYSRTGDMFVKKFQSQGNKVDSYTWGTLTAEKAADAYVAYIFDTAYGETSPETQDYLAKLEIPIVEAGQQGCVIRVSEWKTGVEYRNDEGSVLTEGAVGYIDVVGVVSTNPNNNYGFDFYQCKETHYPSTDNNKPGETDCPWTLLQNVGPIYTSLLVAKYAYIRFGTGNEFYITDGDGIVKAGMKGTNETISDPNGIRFWAGSAVDAPNNPITIPNSPFRVYNDGSAVMTDANITGVVNANTGRIGGVNGWTINNQEIIKGTIDTDSDVMCLATKNKTATINGETYNDLRIIMGTKFGVKNDGSLIAANGKFSGEINADNGTIGGFVIGSTQLKSSDNNIVLDSNNQKISVGIIDIESGEGSEGDFPYNWSGIATKSGYGDTVALGAREFPNNGNALYGGHLRLNSSNGGVFDILTGGNTQQALLRMSGKGLDNIRIIADGGKNSDYNDSGLAFIQVVTTNRGADNKSTTIKPTNINTPEVKTNSITTKEVKTTSESIPVELPHNVVLCNSTSYTLPSNPTKGAFVFFKSLKNVTINIASGETAEIYESQGSKLYSSISIGGEAAIFVFDGTNWILFLSH